MSRQAVRAIIIKDNQLLVMKRNKFGKQYYTLLGGGIDHNESAVAALRRELAEETSLQVGALKHVYTEEAGDPFGTQYVFTAEYLGGEPALNPNSEEAKITALGQNTYQPMWLPFSDLASSNFLSESLKVAILEAIKHGFPSEPQVLVWKQSSVA
ncbi:MAG: NUDIX domain-containing protein [Candidatus Saccharimonadales bacterium]